MDATMQSKTEIMDHLNHITYPATKEDLVKACENMSDIPEDDKKWFEGVLTDKTFNSAAEVRKELDSAMQSQTIGA